MFLDSFQMESLLLLREINGNLAQTVSRFFGAYGLTWSQACVLLALGDRDGQTIGELCTLLRAQKSNLSPLCKRLEAAGYVKRIRPECDQRLVRIYLTDSARVLLEKCDLEKDELPQTALTQEQKAKILAGLRQLQQLTHSLADPQDTVLDPTLFS